MTTIITLTYEEPVKFPRSLIKSPGVLLRQSTMDTAPSKPLKSSRSTSYTSNNTIDEAHNFTDTTEESFSEEKALVEFRSYFEVSKTAIVQEFIIKELMRLPESFMTKLDMTVTLIDSPSATDEKSSMRTCDLTSSQKARERLYYVIFNAFLAKFPEVSTLWSRLNNNDDVNKYKNSSDEMKAFMKQVREREIECSFYAIMINKRSSKALNIVKFKELLKELDPEGFTEEWFKDHNRQLKKRYRVRFDDDSDDSA